jgi:hypothetical protein
MGVILRALPADAEGRFARLRVAEITLPIDDNLCAWNRQDFGVVEEVWGSLPSSLSQQRRSF